MDVKKEFHGPRSERFQTLPPVTGAIGPGEYESTALTTAILAKPTSNVGVYIRQGVRFPDVKQQAPPLGHYEHKSFIEDLKKTKGSVRPLLDSGGAKSGLEATLRGSNGFIPGPGTYDINYAIGRHVANDDRFSLHKSARLQWRDQKNRGQLAELRKLLVSDDIFTDKRACRRMAYLALYFPS
ncbi:uncharacterized protein EV422DRAFT_532079 [Fimicolochytrium jonesii]|uniref:uncharacterized protein n=1 Tax=Fimicolochytrium jonesii TaxID=1396493 RepID=UPI0022FE8B93|nr:uncharacterized protein EV422DRAFT_532079 [Fimicolochytrium jonesii]KAI8820222.1 hypothetical protein EV422DRAFT_532079 [Fimicolochytrium jonesii]